MQRITFVTGNQKKADYLAKLLGRPIEHIKLDLDEIQSTELSDVVTHKAKQAYAQLKRPVLVEDASLEFSALGRLPGTFIKWFETELGCEGMCRLLDGFDDRSATAAAMFGYYDGERLQLIEGGLRGEIVKRPKGDAGFGYDPIFVPDGFDVTRAEMSEEDDHKTYLIIKPVQKLRNFLDSLDD